MEPSSTRNLLDPAELIEIEYTPASRSKRLANYFIDVAICIVVLIVLVVILGLLGIVFESDRAYNLIFYAGYITYHTFFEGLIGRTPGKMITGTQVINEQGQPISFWQALGRSFSRLIPFDALTFISRVRPRGLHDKVSSTWVVDKLTPRLFPANYTETDSTTEHE
jgi:uncharacterized RDD family membrane protein YckC